MFLLSVLNVALKNGEEDTEHTFAEAVLAIFFLLILYIFLGALMEHKHVK